LKSEVNSTEYILGTDAEELHRLGYQHRAWSKEAHALWHIAGFSQRQTLLDLGCGPGFTTFDLAGIVGSSGTVIAIDKSADYMHHLKGLMSAACVDHVDARTGDYMSLKIAKESLDGAYARWSLPWVDNPEEVVQLVVDGLKPGACFAVQEYLDWSTFCLYPKRQEVARVIEAALQGWTEMEGDINIGARLPRMFTEAGLVVEHIAPLSKIGRPCDLHWEWPSTFWKIYTLKLRDMGYLSNKEVEDFLQAWNEAEKDPSAFIFTPQMVEIIGRKR
jgi:ubiquinone/menaquinone biosynthesis C-methylase UbiE